MNVHVTYDTDCEICRSFLSEVEGLKLKVYGKELFLKTYHQHIIYICREFLAKPLKVESCQFWSQKILVKGVTSQQIELIQKLVSEQFSIACINLSLNQKSTDQKVKNQVLDIFNYPLQSSNYEIKIYVTQPNEWFKFKESSMSTSSSDQESSYSETGSEETESEGSESEEVNIKDTAKVICLKVVS